MVLFYSRFVFVFLVVKFTLVAVAAATTTISRRARRDALAVKYDETNRVHLAFARARALIASNTVENDFKSSIAN